MKSGRPVPFEAFDWDDLRFLVAAARAGSLSDAARRLRVSVATVGRRIDRLEEAIGQRLFHRHSGGLVMVPTVEPLLEQAETIAEHVRAFAQTAATLNTDETGTVTVTTIETLITHVIAPSLGEFLVAHPGIEVILRADPRIVSLSERLADIALRVVRPSEARVAARKVSTIRLGLFASTSYLDRKGHPADPTTSLAGHDVVLYDARLDGMPETIWLQERHRGAGREIRVSSAASMAQAVHSGAGLALVPEILARGSWQCLVPASELPMRDLWLVMHEDLRDVPHIRAVADFLARVTRSAVGPPQ